MRFLLLLWPLLLLGEDVPAAKIDPQLSDRILRAGRDFQFASARMLAAEVDMLKKRLAAEALSKELAELIEVAEGICDTGGKDFDRQKVKCVDRPEPALSKLR